MARGPKKNQHTVSQFYLKNFATPESRAKNPLEDDLWAINRYMKEKGLLHREQRISSVAAENYFYDVPNDPDQRIENHLMQIEGHASKVVTTIIAQQTTDNLGSSELFNLAHFIATSHVRTQKYRRRFVEFLKLMSGAQEQAPDELAEALRENQDRNQSKNSALCTSRLAYGDGRPEAKRRAVAGDHAAVAAAAPNG